MLSLRFRLAFLNSEAALAAAPRVTELMAESLGWDAAEQARQLEHAKTQLSEFGSAVPCPSAEEKAELSAPTATDLSSIFATLDLDGNGYIDLQEFKRAAMQIGCPFSDTAEAQRAFDEIDTHRDGRISEDDFIEWWSVTGPDDALRRRLSGKMQMTLDKLGSDARGVMFG
jgi:glycerol-3-phosphate dehydrogenase